MYVSVPNLRHFNKTYFLTSVMTKFFKKVYLHCLAKNMRDPSPENEGGPTKEQSSLCGWIFDEKQNNKSVIMH